MNLTLSGIEDASRGDDRVGRLVAVRPPGGPCDGAAAWEDQRMLTSVEYAIARFLSATRPDDGASLVEYALLVAVIALVLLVAVRL